MREWAVAVFGVSIATSVVGVLVSLPFTGWPDGGLLLAIAGLSLLTGIALARSGLSLSTYWRWLRRPPRQGL